jgi:mRNA-degrading endonuclease RelE of RelBE toxin-antitoxin system
MYYIVYMVFYEDEIFKKLKNGKLPRTVFTLFNNAFIALNVTHDMNLFDIKRLKLNSRRPYFRIRKNQYRAIFYIENKKYYVINIAKRGEVYRRWE